MSDSQNPPIRAVLFDFGGVVAEEGFREGLSAIARAQGLDPEGLLEAGMDAVYDSGFVIGRATEHEFWALMRQRTGIRGTDAELTQMVLSRFIVRPWMLQWADRLRAVGYVTGILSDQTDWLDRLDERTHFSRHFDHIFNSFHLGKGKRDPGVFDQVAKLLGLSAPEILFIDDSPGNVARAKRRGLQTILYQNREQVDRELTLLPDLRLIERHPWHRNRPQE